MRRAAFILAGIVFIPCLCHPAEARETVAVLGPVAVLVWLWCGWTGVSATRALKPDLEAVIAARRQRIELDRRLAALEGREPNTEALLAELRADIRRIKGE